MKNRELYLRDPLSFELLNNGVSKVAEIGGDLEQLKTLRFELETFVCDGEYARGLERILAAYMDGLNKPEQKAAWISGFFGSGKSHLAKMLRYLWVDFKFPDGASARSMVHLPESIADLLVELSNRSKQYGGTRAVAGTLGAGSMDNVRLAFLQVLFRAAGLPENVQGAKFVLWLRQKDFHDRVVSYLKDKKRDPEFELRNFYASTELAEALVAMDSTYGTAPAAQAAIRAQFPREESPTIDDALLLTKQIFGNGQTLPCTLIVIDEVQQFIGDKVQRAMDVQEIAEHFSTELDSRVLLVGTGQSALTGTASLSRLQARFSIKVPLSDTDVETVIRKTVLAKKSEKIAPLKEILEANSGEISRHLQNTRIAPTAADDRVSAADYPLLPVRRRFWERVLRNVDMSGTTAQLRTQLKIVFEATRQTADEPLGTVVPAEFIYDQVSSDLLNTGQLPREYHEQIMSLRDGTSEGGIKSQLCALIYLIHQLPRTPGADDNIRATAESLADLLVQDLRSDGAKYRELVPRLLDELTAQGKVMQVDTEFSLQTRESAIWTNDFNRRRSQIKNDEHRLGTERERILLDYLGEALRPVSIHQGSSRQSRKLTFTVSQARPEQPDDQLVLWTRHGWSEQQKVVENDARAAGTDSPMLYAFLPRVQHDEFNECMAAALAAQETLESHGTPGPDEARLAQRSIQTHLEAAQDRIENCVRQVLEGSRVFLGGGSELPGLELADRVRDAATNAIQRLFPKFADADHPAWSQVLNGARGGNVGSLQSVGYNGETVRHPVCSQVYDAVGAGKKGKEVRELFKKSPFGWPQDAIDGSLAILTLAGNLRATVNGQPVSAKELTQTQISGAVFSQDVPPLTMVQRMDLRTLFQSLGITTKNGEESAAAARCLDALLLLAGAAGGDPPCPQKPEVKSIRDLQSLSGNSQLLEIHKRKDGIAGQIRTWQQTKDEITRRLPRWNRLAEFHRLASGLAVASEVDPSMSAIEASRKLLEDPDHVPPLIQKLVVGLREALNVSFGEFKSTFERESGRLESNPIWKHLDSTQRKQIVEQYDLHPPKELKLATEEDIVNVLHEAPLPTRRMMIDALSQRFNAALEQAAKLLEPKASRVSLPSVTIRTDAELDEWLARVRELVKAKLGDGPVIF